MRDDLDPALMGEALAPSEEKSFSISRCLGVGARADTFLGQEPAQGGRKAVRKLFHEEFSQDNPDLIELYFPRLATIDHPYLAKVQAYGWEEQRVYLQSDFIDGTPITEALPSLSPKQILSVFAQLLIALDYLYAHNILHLNLKPGNILLFRDPATGEPHLKLLDYGLSNLLHPFMRRELEAIGTAPFTAPEYAIRRALDVRSDLYSVGVLLYFALSRKFPYEGRDLVSILQLQLKQDAPELKPAFKEVPPAMAEVVKRLLARDPQSRYGSPRAALKALMEADPGKFPRQGIAWPSLFSNPDEIFFYQDYLKLFRRIALQGGRWGIHGPAGSGKSFLARWLERLFWLNQKEVYRLGGRELSLLEGEHTLNPSYPTFLIIDDADEAAVEAWLQVRPYLHVVTFGHQVPWATKEKRWQSYELKRFDSGLMKEFFHQVFGQVEDRSAEYFFRKTRGIPEEVVQQGRALARQGIIHASGISWKWEGDKLLRVAESAQADRLGSPFESFSPLAQRISLLLAFAQVPLGVSEVAACLKAEETEIISNFGSLVQEGQVARQVRLGQEYFISTLATKSHLASRLSHAEAKEWLEFLFEKEWWEAGIAAAENYFPESLRQKPDFVLMKSRFLERLGQGEHVMGLITSDLVNQLSDPQKGVAYEILGRSLMEAEKFKSAQASFQRASASYQSGKNPAGLLRILLDQGELFQRMGETKRSLEYFQGAFHQAEGGSISSTLRGLLELKLGQFYEAATDYENAAQRYEASLGSLQSQGNSLALAETHFHLSQVSFALGDFPKTEALAREALRLAVFKRSYLLQGKVFFLLSRLEEKQGNTAKFFQRLNEAVWALRKGPPSKSLVQALVQRAAWMEQNRQLLQAEQDAELALRYAGPLKLPELSGQAHLLVGKILRSDFKRLSEALERFELAKKDFEKSGRPADAWECEYESGEIKRVMGDFAAAKDHLELAIKRLEETIHQLGSDSPEATQLEMRRRYVEMTLKSMG